MSSVNRREVLLQHVTGGLRALDGELDLMDQAIADALHLNRTEAQCLDLISRGGGVTPGELARRIGLTAGAISVVLDRLEQHGWIVRQHDPTDRRRILVRPHLRKSSEMRSMFSGIQASTRRALERYTDADLRLIDEFLALLTALVTEHRDRLGRRSDR